MSENAIRGIDIHWYLVKDAARAITFYRDVMGLTPTWTGKRGAEFQLADGGWFGIWLDDGPWSQGNGVMFNVPDAKTAAAHYGARGAKVLGPVHEGAHCSMAFVEDTEGNHFILHERKA